MLRYVMFMLFSKSFKVTDFGSNGNPVCDFLRANNSNFHPILHRFQYMADYWSNCCCRQGWVPLVNALVWGEALNLGLRNFV